MTSRRRPRHRVPAGRGLWRRRRATCVFSARATRIVAERSAERGFEAQARGRPLLASGCDGAAGYVAAGQGTDYWMARAAEHRARRLERTLGWPGVVEPGHGARRPRQAAGLPRAVPRASTSARGNTSGQDQRLMASDVIFTEMQRALTGESRGHIDQARTSSARWRDSRSTALRQQQAYVLGGRRGGRACFARCCSSRAAGRRLPRNARGAARGDERRVAGGRRGAACRAGHRTAIDMPPGRTAAVIPSRRRRSAAARVRGVIGPGATARLCADLARVGDAGDAPGAARTRGPTSSMRPA